MPLGGEHGQGGARAERLVVGMGEQAEHGPGIMNSVEARVFGTGKPHEGLVQSLANRNRERTMEARFSNPARASPAGHGGSAEPRTRAD